MKISWLVACGAFVIAAHARADTLTSTLGQPLREISHSVDVVIKDGVAVYKVRRVFANAGTVADEAGLEIDLPYGGAATGLRIRARTRWYDGELLEREEAARLYQEMTGFGSHRPKDPALLQWLWADKLFLQVFPVFPGAASTVEYTLTVPTRYQRGQVFLSYPHVKDLNSTEAGDGVDVAPALSLPLAKPVVTLRPSWADAVTPILLDGRPILSETPVVLQQPSPPPWADELGVSEAGAVMSTLVVSDVDAARFTVSAVTVDIDIEHTYRSDLLISLITPEGDLIGVEFGGDVGSDNNDVRGRFVVALKQPRTAIGTWRLLVQDVVARDAGTLNHWGLSFGGDTPVASPAARPVSPGPATKPTTATVRPVATTPTPKVTTTATKATHQVTASDTPLFIPDVPESESDAGTAVFAIAAPAVDVLAARLGKVVASKEHSFSRLEIDVAAELRPLPKQAQLVFVVDASHSMGEAGIATQLDLVRAQLAHVPDAECDIVLYRRRASRLFGRFVKSVDIDAALAAVAPGDLAPGNGSALDEGVKLAVKAMDGRGPQHLVLFGDELLRPDFQNGWVQDELRALAKRTVVHVIVPKLNGSDEVHLRRDDEASLSPLAAEHHGILARIDGLPADQKKLKPVALGLVRPTQIDAFRVSGFAVAGSGYADDADDDGDDGDDGHNVDPGVLHEGEGRRRMLLVARAADEVVLSGKIWGDRFRRVVKKTEKFSAATAAFVFGEDEHQLLDEAEMMRVALQGRAVSPVTSYLAAEPGVRPSHIGLQRDAFGAGGLGSRGSGAGGGGFGHGVRIPPDFKSLVDADACLRAHGEGAFRIVLDVDTTEDEVVDVKVREDSSAALSACLVEAVWAVRLDGAFNLEREHFVVVWH